MPKSKQLQSIWKQLKKYGIEDEADLEREYKKMKPLNIGIMTSSVEQAPAEGA